MDNFDIENNENDIQEQPELISDDCLEIPKPDELDIKKERGRFSRIGLGLALFSAVSVLAATLLYTFFYLANKALAESTLFANILSPVAIYLFALPLLLLILNTVQPKAPERRKLGFSKWLLFLIVGFGLMYIGNYIGIGVNALISGIKGSGVDNPLESLMGMDILIVNLIAMVIIAPIGEEFIFRKLLMDRLERYGGYVSIIISALAFGLMHGNFSQFFYAFFLGLVLGYMYHTTGNVWLTAALHASINFVGGIIPTLLSSRLVTMENDYMSIMENAAEENLTAELMLFMREYGTVILGMMLLLFFIFASMITAVVLPIALRKRIKVNRGEVTIPKGKIISTVLLNLGMAVALAVYIAEFILNTV